MKLQDSVFVITLIALTVYKKGAYTWHAGIISFIGSGMLFLIGNLFTAQRLSWYAAAFITIYLIHSIVIKSQNYKK